MTARCTYESAHAAARSRPRSRRDLSASNLVIPAHHCVSLTGGWPKISSSLTRSYKYVFPSRKLTDEPAAAHAAETSVPCATQRSASCVPRARPPQDRARAGWSTCSTPPKRTGERAGRMMPTGINSPMSVTCARPCARPLSAHAQKRGARARIRPWRGRRPSKVGRMA